MRSLAEKIEQFFYDAAISARRNCKEESDNLRSSAEQILVRLKIEFSYPGLYPVFRFDNVNYYCEPSEIEKLIGRALHAQKLKESDILREYALI